MWLKRMTAEGDFTAFLVIYSVSVWIRCWMRKIKSSANFNWLCDITFTENYKIWPSTDPEAGGGGGLQVSPVQFLSFSCTFWENFGQIIEIIGWHPVFGVSNPESPPSPRFDLGNPGSSANHVNFPFVSPNFVPLKTLSMAVCLSQ